ncbi:hypothetical protein OZX57_08195 [Bifidobacterium sp. ESL0682]|uniref:hypothetical protein n=1 Tax=Bifidobacterium sp. ESL0682 TaxID=2983212 RepID=UPI0023F93AD6|nr:hypothetical protein [Bifidobacterium sp. ESL0682]WEV41903.1 hypothetical protein OZX57_08195 [Bifidobacterium sp. ESL0682]
MSTSFISKFRRPLVRAIAAVAAVASLGAFAACGSTNEAQSNDNQTSSSSKSDKSQGFPVSIKHVYGTTTIKAKPKRVATVGWGSFDNLIALDVAPVSIEKNTFGKTVRRIPAVDLLLIGKDGREAGRYASAARRI